MSEKIKTTGALCLPKLSVHVFGLSIQYTDRLGCESDVKPFCNWAVEMALSWAGVMLPNFWRHSTGVHSADVDLAAGSKTGGTQGALRGM